MFWRIIGFIIGLFRINNNRQSIRRRLQTAENQNAINKRVATYHSTPVESFISERGNENVIASGGNNIIRNRIACQMARNTNRQGKTVVVLHCGNVALENAFNNAFGSNANYHCINSSNPIYDPFVALNKYEISQLVIDSSGTQNKVNPNGGKYIDALSEYLIARGQRPLARRYIECPHDQILNRISQAASNGLISQSVAQSIIAQVQTGVAEQGGVEQFFKKLNQQAGQILASPSNASQAISVNENAKNNGVLVIDIVSATNRLLINIITEELNAVMAKGQPVTLILDSIPIDSSESLKDMINKFSGNNNFVISTNDLYSDMHASDTELDAILGKASTSFIMRHSSAETNKKFSDRSGHYRKIELTTVEGIVINFNNLTALCPSDGSVLQTVTQYVDRPCIEESEINDMNSDDVYIMTATSREIIFVTTTPVVNSNTAPPPPVRRRNRRRVSGTGVNWLVFFILFFTMPPVALIYSFIVSNTRGKIISAIVLALFIAYIIAAIQMSI